LILGSLCYGHSLSEINENNNNNYTMLDIATFEIWWFVKRQHGGLVEDVNK